MVIHLISGPRNISTALMYSFARRADTTVLDEPFYPGKEEVIATMETDPMKIFKQIENCEQQKGIVFVKNMGHHLQGYDYSCITQYRNIFLIRDPLQMLVSYAKVRESPSLDDIGLRYQADVFEWLKNQGNKPLVLDGNEVRKNPALVLSLLCHKLGIPFTENMLHWPAGPIAEDGTWARYWYKNVHESTGFLPPDGQNEKIPAMLQSVYEEAMPYYHQLRKHALTA
jgi:hypothetical protein